MSGTEPSKHRLELDGVRGVACLLVLLLHCVVGLIATQPGSFWQTVQFRAQPIMAGGVDLFFILSGVLIGGILMDNRNKHGYFRNFWTRRFARIFPLYFLIIGLAAFAMKVQAIYPTTLGSALTYSSLPLWTYTTFTQNFAMMITGNAGNNILGVTWSLAIEEQFYIFLPFLIFLLPRRSIGAGAIALVAATPFIRAYVVKATGDWHGAYLLTFCRCDALSIGILLAITIRSPSALALAIRFQPWITVVAVVMVGLQACDFWSRVAAPLLNSETYYRGLVLTCAQFPLFNVAMAGLMLNLFTASDGPLHAALRNPVLTRVGLVSYAAYMFHQTINWSAFSLIYGGDPALVRWSQAFMPALVLSMTFALSAASYRWFEMPIRRWARAASLRYGATSRLVEDVVS